MLNILWYFVVFSFFGWCFNLIRNLIYDKRFSNKGFLTSPFCPTYGVCAILCYLAMFRFSQNKIVLFVGCTVVMSAAVVIIGTLTEKIIGVKPWDYSYMKFSMGSYITLPFAALLGIIGYVLVSAAVPLLNILLSLIPFWISLIAALSIIVFILADYALSIVTTIRLKHRIKRLRGDFDSIESGVYVTPEKIAELEQNYNKLFTENILRRRLASAFPELKTSAYVKQISERLDKIKLENMKEYTTVYEKNEEKPFAFGFCFVKLFYLFIIGSFLGTLFETVWAIFAEGHFEMRVGMVYGPFIPVYGGGACFLTAVLYKLYKLSDTLIFVISAIVGAMFEYMCSWFQETVFGTVSWDYSDMPFNLDGRTSLMYALIWGFLGLVWVRYLYPFAAKNIEKIPNKTGSIVTAFLIIFMIFNAFMTVSSIYRWQQRENGISSQNAFEVYLDNHFNDNKMKFLFPHMNGVKQK